MQGPGDDIYCQPLMSDVIKAMPDIKFVYFGCEGHKGRDKNLEFLGVAPFADIMKKSSMLLRITRHDGFPAGPVEFLCHNRPVVTNVDMPYTRRVDFTGGVLTENNIPAIKQRIITAIRATKNQMPKDQFYENARAHYKRVLNPAILQKALQAIVEGVKK